MAGLNLFTRNQLETLTEKLAEVMSRPLASPLQQEIVLVRSQNVDQ